MPLPLQNELFFAAIGLYAVAWLLAVVKPQIGRWACGAAVLAHLTSTVMRGVAVGYFPLNSKVESFSAAALAIGIVTLLTWQPARLYVLTMLSLVLATAGAAITFPLDLRYPVPPLITIYYPLHVPLSFLAYALWAGAGAASLVYLRGRDPAQLARVDRYALQGFGLWSLSMVFGGIWGVLAWGAYFLWDPKVIWSVILWFHYASFIHLRLTPSLRTRPWVRPALALVGVFWVFVAYVGTSFFFGDSSHAF